MKTWPFLVLAFLASVNIGASADGSVGGNIIASMSAFGMLINIAFFIILEIKK